MSERLVPDGRYRPSKKQRSEWLLVVMAIGIPLAFCMWVIWRIGQLNYGVLP